MSFYDSLNAKIYLMEKHIKENEPEAEYKPWYLLKDGVFSHLKLGFYKILLALARAGLIIRGKPASNFTVFTRAGKEGLYICNYSYCYYKDFHHKTRNKTIATIIAATVLLSIIISLIFPGEPRVRAATYNWSQTNWSGGLDGGTYPNHTSNQSGWTKYSAKDANIVASATNLTLANATSTFLDTTDTDFNAGTHSTTAVSGTGAGAGVVIPWYNASWSYRRLITLSPVTPVANYQVRVTFTNVTLTGAQLTGGNANGNDIRFTDSSGVTLQNYWIESWSAAGTTVTATIWVEVATSGASQIYMYYGNITASSVSNPNIINTITETTDTQFNAGTLSQAKISGTGTAGSVQLNYNRLGSCNVAGVGGADHGGANWTVTDNDAYDLNGAVGTIEIAGCHYNIGNFNITLGTTVYVKAYDGTNYGRLNVSATSVNVAGTLNGSLKGYLGGAGGTTTSGGNGEYGYSGTNTGSYGGAGGPGGLAAGGCCGGSNGGGGGSSVGPIRGDSSSDNNIDMGGGAGGGGKAGQSGAAGATGQAGGGQVQLYASNGATVSGIVLVNGGNGGNGGDGTSPNAGGSGGAGASGGGILITGDTVTVSGTLQANGGSGGAGGTGCGDTCSAPGNTGGGGRIKVFYGSSLNSTGASLSVTGYNAGSTAWVQSSYYSSANFTSQSLDTVQTSGFKNLSWTGSTPSGTTLKFQLAANNDNITWNYVGPDGTSLTYYTASGENIYSGHNGNRYLRYKVYLTTTGASTPSLSDVSISYRKYSSPEPSAGAPGAETAPSGTFTSSIKNQSSSSYWGNIVFNTTLNGGTITMKVRTSNSATMTGAPDWSTCNTITSGTNITGNNCVTSPAQYVQYQATLNIGTSSPTLDDVTIYYGGYAPSATLTSSAFNTQNAGNVLSKLTWTETLPVNTDIKFQVRTAPDSSGAPGTWTAWCGPDNGVSGSCSSATYFTAPAGAETIDDINRDGYVNQWLQYKVWLASTDGVSTPTLSGVSPEYVINTAPAVGSVTASQGSDGVLSIGYNVSDAEQTSLSVSLLADIGVTLGEVLANSTDPGGGAVTVSSASLLPNSGAIQIENEQIIYTGKSGNDLTGAVRAANSTKYAGHSLGAAVWIKGTTVSGSAGAITGITSTPAAKTATWTIKTDLPGVFRDIIASPAKIRVSANDLQAGNPTGTADSANFTLDTKNPVAGAAPIIVDSTISSPTANLTLSASDDSTFQMRFANAANQVTPDCATDLYNKTEAQVAYVSYAASYAHHPLSPNADGISTVCYEFKDAYNNKLQGSASTPKTPASPQITDISQVPLSKYRDLVWWTAQGGGVTYKVYRDSGAGYALLSSVTDPTNYCFDEGDGNCAEASPTAGALTSTTAYSYKVRAEDADGISSYSSVVTATPNGSTVGEVDATPPVISFTEATQGPSTANSTLGDSTASITFSATDASGNYFGSVLYEASASLPAAYSKETANPSLVTSGNTVTVNLAGLVSNTKYYYKLKARDNSGNAATNDNSGVGYFFTTTIDSTAPAAISSLSATVASSSSAALTWTSPGDDNSVGTATSYDIRYSTSAITDANWSSATQVANEPKPAVAGTSQTMTVTGLNPTGAGATYYFAVKTSDEIPNTSSLSNIVSVDIPAQADTNAPVITSVTSGTPSATTVTITWVTNKVSSSLVDFGTTLSYGTIQGNSADSVKNHSVTLTGLAPGTAYKFRVKSVDSSGNVGINDNSGSGYPFTTATSTSGTLPIISSVSASSITATSAVVSWTTSVNADTTVGYSAHPEKTYAQETGNSSQLTSHSATLTNLAPSTKYYYRVKSRNGDQLATLASDASGDFNFTTLAGADSVAPLIYNVQVTSVAANRAAITWTTNENANSYIEFGLAVGSYTSVQGTPNESVLNHSVQLTSLTPETTYYFQVKSLDAAGNRALDNNSGSGYSFTTTSGSTTNCPPAGRATACPTCETCAASDITAPKISGVKVSDITFNSATITWSTDEGANSMVLYDKVSYGVKQGYNYSSGKPKDSLAAHKVTLNNLDSNTTYYFRVSSADSRGNAAESEDQSFKTFAISETKDKGEAATVSLKKQFEDIAQTLVKDNLATEENIKDIISRIASPPIIGSGDPVVKDVKSYGATIVWRTDRKANSVVRFKAASSPSEALAAGNNWKEMGKMDTYDTNHEVELLGLAPSTTYAYQVKSQDVLGNVTSSEAKTFTTSSNSSVFNVNVSDITLNSAKINWETANISTSLVEYGLTSVYGNQVNKGDEKVKAHSVELANLSSGTNYHFRIRSIEESSNILSTEDYTFSTYQLPQITKYDLGEVKDNSIELKWTSNLAIDSNIRYTDKETNETKIIGAPEKTLNHSIVLSNLSAGKAYKIEIQGRDEAGNLAELAPFEVQTGMDIVPPEIAQVRSQAAILGGAEDKVQAIISWKTNELSTSQVLWDLGTTKGDTFANATKPDTNLTTNHIAVITNFKPGTVYRFRVVSSDKFSNISVSPDYSILTPVRRQSVVQMIMSNFEKIFGWTKNLGR